MTKIKNILIIILGLIVGALAVYSIVLRHHIKTLFGQTPTTVQITDTITDWQHDTTFLHSYTTDTLALTDTAIIYDTITNTQFVEVQVPIYTYEFDTSITYCSNFSCEDDSLIVGIKQTVRGYKVELESLILDIKGDLTPVQLQPQKKFRVVPAVGLGYGTGGWGAFCGVGLSYW